MEPEQTPFAAVTAHTSRLQRVSPPSTSVHSGFVRELEMNIRLTQDGNSNIKHGWTNRHHTFHTDGWEPLGSSWFSS
jgi:hypothetical protein